MIRNGYGLVLSLNHQTLGLIVGFTAWLRCIQQSFPTLQAARPHKSGSAGAPCQAGSTWPRAYFPSKILRQFCVFCACSDLQRVVFCWFSCWLFWLSLESFLAPFDSILPWQVCWRSLSAVWAEQRISWIWRHHASNRPGLKWLRFGG